MFGWKKLRLEIGIGTSHFRMDVRFVELISILISIPEESDSFETTHKIQVGVSFFFFRDK